MIWTSFFATAGADIVMCWNI